VNLVSLVNLSISFIHVLDFKIESQEFFYPAGLNFFIRIRKLRLGNFRFGLIFRFHPNCLRQNTTLQRGTWTKTSFSLFINTYDKNYINK